MADSMIENFSLGNNETIDVVVIGGGPSGLSAAIELKRLGVSRVVVLERESVAGGIPRHCGHPPFGMREFKRVLTGPSYAKKLVAAAIAANVEIHTMTTVVEARPDGELLITSNRGAEAIKPRRVIYATGVREAPRSARLVTGRRTSGVINSGALQSMVYLKERIPFERPIIIGTELVSFSTIMTCRHAGIEPVAMIGEFNKITARWPYSVFPRLMDIPFRAGLRLLPQTMGIPLHLGTKLIAIDGDDKVSSVQIKLANGTQHTIECDGVILTGKFTPESTLARCGHLEIDPATGGPSVDQYGRCSDPAYFATGNLLRPVETAGWCWNEGRQTGSIVAGDLQNGLPSFGRQIRVSSVDPMIKFVMPQTIGLPNTSSGMKHLQLRFQQNAEGYLVGTCGEEIVYRRKVSVHPECRIIIALDELTKNCDEKNIQLTFEER